MFTFNPFQTNARDEGWIRCGREDSIMFGPQWFSECRTELVQACLCSIGVFYSSVNSFKGRQTSSVIEWQSAQCSEFLPSHRWLNPIPTIYITLCSVSIIWVLKDIARNNDWTCYSLKWLFSNKNRKGTSVANAKLDFSGIYFSTTAAQSITSSKSNQIYHRLLCSKDSKNHIWSASLVGVSPHWKLAKLVFGRKDKGRIDL